MFMRSNMLVLKNILMLTYYTTRYLGLPTPDDNLAGYQRSDVTAKVTNIDPLALESTVWHNMQWHCKLFSGAKAVKQEIPDGARDSRRQCALPAVHDARQGNGGG